MAREVAVGEGWGGVFPVRQGRRRHQRGPRGLVPRRDGQATVRAIPSTRHDYVNRPPCRPGGDARGAQGSANRPPRAPVFQAQAQQGR